MKRVHNSRDRGVALVELALMLPVLITMFLAAIDLGVILREHQIVQNAAREGARFSSLPQNWINPVNPSANVDAIKQRVIDYLAAENISVAAGNITVNQQYPIIVGGLTLQGSCVTVTYARALAVSASPLLPGNPVTLTGKSVFRNLY